ncbi:MAG TPA: succinate dehydrogenase, hydrophobic membrane anchor protein [Steroidobacteraceae bacterium]|nr:succinate dehydrogenase, hydrophobic membrane anchor protein [Steroidobacteraceae bacterium]
MSGAARALSKVLGKGSAHEGAHHWRVQRLSALALLLLGPWLLVSLLLLPDLGYATLRAWAAGLLNAALLALLVVSACWHSQLGVQVVVEDYVRGWQRMATLIVSAFAHALLGVLGVLAVLRLALGATP